MVNQQHHDDQVAVGESARGGHLRGPRRLLFQSCRMLTLDIRIAGVLVRRYKRTRTTTPNIVGGGEVSVTRVDMNLFHFTESESSSSSSSSAVVEANEAAATTTVNAAGKYDDTAALMRIVAVVMQDVQQRNLNAKHAAASTSRLAAGTTHAAALVPSADSGSITSLIHGDLQPHLYIGLNRSCSQRKLLEICCVLRSHKDRAALFGDAQKLARASPTFHVLYENEKEAMVYIVLQRCQLAPVLSNMSHLPRLVFASCKNQIFHGSGGVAPTAQKRQLAYVANFVTYHSFHESDMSFDERRFGARFRHMRSLIFIAAVINAELLRQAQAVAPAAGRGINLALNIQSLDKAYDDVGLHVFAENSIQQMRKTVSSSTPLTTTTGGCVRGERSGKRVPRRRSYYTDGLLVNRYLGRVSRVGINAVTLTLPVV